ncbi:hypothetical protein H4N64_18220 [Streptomyces sp. PSKA01]|uniref:Uncharacterized protein n=1 Tax=Streptomyces cupreus TaxID=2759956 RepID=A0A7X1MCB5_9ACTN|nr:hypothetical protein [Streptomyces cupreus]
MGFLVNTDPVSGYQQYDQPTRQDRTARNKAAMRRTALTISTIGDIAAGLLGLWILLYLLDANQGNAFVEFVHGSADWLSGWAQDIFTMDTEGLRVVLNYGLPAVVYLALGHGIAARLNRA